MASSITFSEEMIEKVQQLARIRKQNVQAMLEVLVEQAWLQEVKGFDGKNQIVDVENTSGVKVSAAVEDSVMPNHDTIVEKLWGSLGQGTQEEIDEIFSYDYDYELSQR